MKPTLSEIDELKLLLELVREARLQVEAGGQPALGGFLKAQGLSNEQANLLIEQWTRLITDLLDEKETKPATLSERKDNLQTGALRLLFACFVPDYRSRLQEDIRYLQAPENEQRFTIELTSEEIHRILQASLIDGAWAA